MLEAIRTLWTIVRIINIIILCRLLRMIVFIRSMMIITSVLVDIIKNLRAFIGILVVRVIFNFLLYYYFLDLDIKCFNHDVFARSRIIALQY